MKKLTGLEEKLEKLNEKDSDMQSFKEFFKAAVSFSITKSGDEAVDLFEIAIKIRRANGEVDLEDAEFKKLSSKVGENPVGWPSWVHAQLVSKLRAIEKESEKK